MATSKDVAERAGVSRATVWAVLSSGRYVSPDVAERVQAAVEELNYRPNAIARSLKARKTQTVGLVGPRLLSYFSLRIVRAAEEVLREQGYGLILEDTGESADNERRVLALLRERRVDGLIIIPCSHDVEAYERHFLGEGVPVVLIDRRFDELGLDTVVSNNEQGGFIATSHLLALGYRRIAMITPALRYSSVHDRFAGYQRALGAHGLAYDPTLTRVAPWPELETAPAIAMELLTAAKPEAVISASELITFGVLEAAKRLGLRMPRDVALLGFDEEQWCAYADPPLTTVAQNTPRMGAYAAQLLLQRLAGRGPTERVDSELDTTLIVRSSCGELVPPEMRPLTRNARHSIP